MNPRCERLRSSDQRLTKLVSRFSWSTRDLDSEVIGSRILGTQRSITKEKVKRQNRETVSSFRFQVSGSLDKSESNAHQLLFLGIHPTFLVHPTTIRPYT